MPVRPYNSYSYCYERNLVLAKKIPAALPDWDQGVLQARFAPGPPPKIVSAIEADGPPMRFFVDIRPR
jgi:hypothetical protein